MKKIREIYEKLVTILFFAYLTVMLSLGRVFAIFPGKKIGPVPVFVTELFLLIAAPLVLFRIKKVLEWPKELRIVLTVYFSIGIIYLVGGVLNENLYSLRDVVLCGYILFLPLTFIVFTKNGNLKLFFRFYILSNLISIIAGILCVFRFSTHPVLINFYNNSKFFNFGLYYGMAFSIFFCLLPLMKKRLGTAFFSLLVPINIYMIILMVQRALWVSLIALLLFLLIMLKSRFIKIISKLLVFSIAIFLILFIINFKFPLPQQHISELKTRVRSTRTVLRKIFKVNLNKPTTPPEAVSQQSPSLSASEVISPKPDVRDYIPLKGPLKFVDKIMRSANNSDQSVFGNIFWRLRIWQQAIEFGSVSPLTRIFGKGFGVNPDYWISYEDQISSKLIRGIGVDSKLVPAHNELITIYYKMGGIGLILFIAINWLIFRCGLKCFRQCKNDFTRYFLIGSLGAFVFWHVMALFFDVIDSPSTSIFLWIISGVILVLVRKDKVVA